MYIHEVKEVKTDKGILSVFAFSKKPGEVKGYYCILRKGERILKQCGISDYLDVIEKFEIKKITF